jgi:hypothetical protein
MPSYTCLISHMGENAIYYGNNHVRQSKLQGL